MPRFEITGPDGKRYEVTAPEGASEQDVMAYVRQSSAQQQQQPEPSVGQKLLKSADDTMRGIASGMTFGFADEMAAGLSSMYGVGGQGGSNYETALAAERARDKSIPLANAIPSQVAGGLLTGKAATDAGVSLMTRAQPTVGSMMGRGAAEGAGYGALHGFGAGEGGIEERAKSAGLGAALGAGAGAVTGGVTSAFTPKPKAPTTGDLRKAGGAAYKAAEDAGVVVSPQSFGSLVDDIALRAREAGIDRDIHPKATAALRRLEEAREAGKSLPLKDVEILRRVLKSAAGSNERDEQRIANLMIDRLDDYFDGLTSADVVAGAPEAGKMLEQARGLWARTRKAETVDDIVRAAELSASGVDAGLRSGFRALAKSEKRLRGFSGDERAAIRKVAEGGPTETVLRLFGRMAPSPTNVMGGALGAGAGYGVGGTAGALAAPALGFAARQGATAMTQRNARLASELIRAGGKVSLGQLSPQQAALLEGVLITEAQQLPPLAVPMLPSRQTTR